MTTSSKVPTAVVLSLLLTNAHGFATVRPLASKATVPSHRGTVPIYYVDDKSSEETPLQKKTALLQEESSTIQVELEQFTFSTTNDNNDSIAALPLVIEPTDTPLPTLSDKVPALPTLSDFQKFALPCLGLWVSGPLLSFVDSVFVGLSGPAAASSVQLAALGPATTLFDCLTWLLSFLNVATTNLFSGALAKQSDAEAEGVVRTGSCIGLLCGLGVMGVLIAFANPILASYMGPQAAATPGVLQGASTYLSIRALSMPTFLLMGVLQSALLGAKDSVTPLKAILYSTIVNLVGDYFLVSHLGMGLKGAAIATTAAQWVATLAMLMPARKKLMRDGKLKLFNLKEKSAVTTKQFMAFATPVVTLLAGKLAAFGFLTKAAAKVPGQPVPLACHQIIFSLFLFLCPFTEVINQTAQTFLPQFVAPVQNYVKAQKARNPEYREKSDPAVRKWEKAANKVSSRLIQMSFVSAALVATLGAVVPAYFGGALTRDVTVQNALKPLAKYLWACTFLMGPMSSTEGVLLAKHKTWFLAIMYMVSTSVFPYFLMTAGSSSIASIWGCFGLFQLYRATVQFLRVTGSAPMDKARRFVRNRLTRSAMPVHA